MQKTYELRDQFAASRSRPYVGAAIGASVGWMLFRKLFGSRSEARLRRLSVSPYTERSYIADTGYIAEGGYSEDFYGVDQPAPVGVAMEGHDFYVAPDLGGEASSNEGGIKERASGAVSAAAGKASGAAHSVAEKASGAAHSVAGRATDAVSAVKDRASNLRERVPSASEVQHRGAEWYQRSVQEQPLVFALGAVALGMVASALIPVSGKERSIVAPAKAKVIEPAMQKAQSALENLGQKAEAALGGSTNAQQGQQQSGIILSASDTGTMSASPTPQVSTAQNLNEDPMAKDEFGLGIPDPQTFPSRH